MADSMAQLQRLSETARVKAMQEVREAERKGWQLTRLETWTVESYTHVVLHFSDSQGTEQKSAHFEVPGELPSRAI